MRQLFIILYLVLVHFSIPEALAHCPDDELANMTYIIGDENHSQMVRLVDGKYRYPVEHPLLCVYYEGKFVYGDFNNDELLDAAVVIYDSGGGSGYSLNLAFLINDGVQLVHKSSYYLGYKADVIHLDEEDGKVVVHMWIYDEDTWAEGIMKRAQVTYEYTGPTEWGADLGYPVCPYEEQTNNKLKSGS